MACLTDQPESSAPAAPDSAMAEVLAFRIGNEDFGIDIQAVRELRGYTAVTRLAESPDYLTGVINLRGVIVPIVDLRRKLGLGEASYNEFTVVIVLAVRQQAVGIVVDSVSDVVKLAPEQIKSPPPCGAQHYLNGIATVDQRLLQLANLDLLLHEAAALPLAA